MESPGKYEFGTRLQFVFQYPHHAWLSLVTVFILPVLVFCWYSIYQSQLNIWLRINRQAKKALYTCYTLAVAPLLHFWYHLLSYLIDPFPCMEQFANNWATQEFMKGICQNAWQHCCKKGSKDLTLGSGLLEANDNGNANAGNKDVWQCQQWEQWCWWMQQPKWCGSEWWGRELCAR